MTFTISIGTITVQDLLCSLLWYQPRACFPVISSRQSCSRLPGLLSLTFSCCLLFSSVFWAFSAEVLLQMYSRGWPSHDGLFSIFWPGMVSYNSLHLLILWYRQLFSGEMVFLIYQPSFDTQNQRSGHYSVVFQKSFKSISLVISASQPEDSGTYFCALSELTRCLKW